MKSKFLALPFVLLAAISIKAQASPAAVSLNESGKSRYAQGDKTGAIADFTKAIEIASQYAMAYNNRGATRNDIGDFDGANAPAAAESLPAAASLSRLVIGFERRTRGRVTGEGS